MEKVMTDFVPKPYHDPKEDMGPPLLTPINYYDNEDGFWDDYIRIK